MTPGQRWADAALLAISFLTRLPVKLRVAPGPGALAGAMIFFPLVGGVIGLMCSGAYALAIVALPVGPASLLAIAAGILLTGGLHEDGLADCADGLGGGSDKERAWAIMHDSRIGSFGAIALILSVALRATALAGIERPARVAAALISAHAVARALLPAAMLSLPPANSVGLAAEAGRPGASVAAPAAILALAVAVLCLPRAAALAAVAAAGAAVMLVGWLARRRIGGYSGDVLGAMEQSAEIAALLAILAVFRRLP
jgi:adenosylcobinamide-GDP ribazoletransferase